MAVFHCYAEKITGSGSIEDEIPGARVQASCFQSEKIKTSL